MITFRCLRPILLVALLASAAVPAVRAGDAPPPTPDAGPRISLNFPGGTLDEFVAALEAAHDGPVNLVRPDGPYVVVPAIKVSNVNLGQVFTAVQNAERRIRFEPAATGGQTTVWAVRLALQTRDRLMVRSYAVERLLEKYSIDDLTTAIGASWEMGRQIDKTHARADQPEHWFTPAPEPELKFHQETKLLIIRGTNYDLQLAENVITQLTPPQRNAPPPEVQAAMRANLLEMEASRLSLEGELQRLQKESPDNPQIPAFRARLQAVEERIKGTSTADIPPN